MKTNKLPKFCPIFERQIIFFSVFLGGEVVILRIYACDDKYGDSIEYRDTFAHRPALVSLLNI